MAALPQVGRHFRQLFFGWLLCGSWLGHCSGAVQAEEPPLARVVVPATTAGPQAQTPLPPLSTPKNGTNPTGNITSEDKVERTPDLSKAAPAVAPPEQVYPIDLVTALKLAESLNPYIAKSRVAIQEAVAQRMMANALLLPTFRGGGNYHLHNGILQTSFGLMRLVNSRSLYQGWGARTLAAESVAFPGLGISSPLTDAFFLPLVARQQVSVRQAESVAVAQDILLRVATKHLDLMAAQLRLLAIKQSEADLHKIVEETEAFARTGRGRLSEANRARTEALLLHTEEQQAEEDVVVSAAELSRLLHLDPVVRLQVPCDFMELLHLVNPQTDLDQLLHIAVAQRPDLAAVREEIARRELQIRQEKWRPFLPTIWLGYSVGTFGGFTSRKDLVPVRNNWDNFGGRTDFDIRVWWEILNLGAGNHALVHQRCADRNTAMAELSRRINDARREVAGALAEVQVQRQQVEIARARLQRAELGLKEDYARSRGGEGLPIELLNNMNRLRTARVNLVNVYYNYNRAQVRLYVSLGQPPLWMFEQEKMPTPPLVPPGTSQPVLATPTGGTGNRPPANNSPQQLPPLTDAVSALSPQIPHR
jgi:outer membrane protein TolC